MGTVRSIAMIVLIFEVIFSKPTWCKEKGQSMDVIAAQQENCAKDTNEVNYYRSKLPVIDTGIDTYIKIFCLIFLATSKIHKMSLNVASKDNMKAAVSCLLLALSYIALVVLHRFGAFRYINIQDMIVMLFILIYNDNIRRASGRMFQIAIESVEVLIVFASVMLALACLARILFFGSGF